MHHSCVPPVQCTLARPAAKIACCMQDWIQPGQEVWLLVILCAGPYICGKQRVSSFVCYVTQPSSKEQVIQCMYIMLILGWVHCYILKIKSLLYENGEPIIAVPVENEHGSYSACCATYLYMSHLKGKFWQYLGPNVILFTTDGVGLGFLKIGCTSELYYATVDFDPCGNPMNHSLTKDLYSELWILRTQAGLTIGDNMIPQLAVVLLLIV